MWQRAFTCDSCNKVFYSKTIDFKKTYTRHLGQCTRHYKKTNNSNLAGLGSAEITYIHEGSLNIDEYPNDYFADADDDISYNSEGVDVDNDTLFLGIPDEVIHQAYEIYGADRVMIESTLDGQHLLLSTQEKAEPSQFILKYQQMIEHSYNRNADGSLSKKPIVIRNLSSKPDSKRHWEDTVEIFNLWVALNISISEGDKILSTFKSICMRNYSFELPLPKSMKSIVDACKGVDEELFPSKTWLYHLPPKLFGEIGLDGQPLKPTSAIIRDIGTVIGRALLDVSVENFAIAPDIIKSSIDEGRLFGSYTTGTHFESLHREVISNAIPNNNIEIPTVALALAISSDVTTLNKSQTQDGNGLQLLLMNVCGKERIPHLVGMIPERNNTYSIRQLHQLLINRGFKFQKDRTAIIAYVTRQMKLSYISEALSPVLIYQQSGVTVQVGNNRDRVDSIIIRAYPHLVLILADTLESNQYAGVSMKTKKQCRCCLQGNCNECLIELAIGERRHQNHHNIISTLAGTIQELMWVHTSNFPGKKLKLNESQRNVLNEAGRLCIQFGHNPMYVHFSLQNNWKINSLHQAVLPDSLHTWSKGMIENLISQTLICFRQVARLNKNYCHNLSMLDTNISAFPSHHTLSPWRFSRFPRGITSYQKKNKSKKEGTCTTGFFSGSIPAYRLSGLLAQVLFSIRLDGTSLPTGGESNTFYESSMNDNQVLLEDDMTDIQNTLVDAIVIALDFDMYSRAPFMKDSDISSYKKLLSNTVFRFIKLFRMNSILSQLGNSNTGTSSTSHVVAKNPGGVKMHLLFHTMDNIERVGKEKNSTDTEVTESYQKVVKGASERGTQKIRTEGVEVIKVVNRQLRAHDLEWMIHSSNREEVSNNNMVPTISDLDNSLHFVVAKNCSHQDIVLDHINNTIVVQEKYKNVNGKRVELLPLVHEILSLQDLFKLLVDKFETHRDKQLRLLNSIKCLGSQKHGIEPFMIHANSNYSTEVGGHVSMQSKRQDFGFIKVDVEDLEGNINEYSALVVGIVEESSINVKETDRIIYSQNVLICWLESVPEREVLISDIPYPQVKLTFVNQSPTSSLWFDVVPTSAIKAPLFAVPNISSVTNYCMGQSILPHRKKIRFYELSVDRVIYWSTADYDNFTEGQAPEYQDNSLPNLHTVLLQQTDIELQSGCWRDEEEKIADVECTLEIDNKDADSLSIEEASGSENEDLGPIEEEEDYDLDWEDETVDDF